MRRTNITEEVVNKAIKRALAGEGRQLALLIKSVSLKDLSEALVYAGPRYMSGVSDDLFLYGLRTVFAIVEGRRQGRADFLKWKREAIAKAKQTAAESPS